MCVPTTLRPNVFWGFFQGIFHPSQMQKSPDRFAICCWLFAPNPAWSFSKRFFFSLTNSEDCLGSDSGIPSTPVTGGSSSGIHHHGDLLPDLKPGSFSMSANKILFDDPSGSGLMAASRSMSSLMASQFGTKDHAASVLHLPSTAFASYHPAAHYDGGSLANLHQHVQPALYHGHRDQAFSHA